MKVVEKNNKKYPKLMKSSVSGSIYLMTSDTVGTKLTKGENDNGEPIGYHYDYWAGWELYDYDGTIEISN